MCTFLIQAAFDQFGWDFKLNKAELKQLDDGDAPAKLKERFGKAVITMTKLFKATSIYTDSRLHVSRLRTYVRDISTHLPNSHAHF